MPETTLNLFTIANTILTNDKVREHATEILESSASVQRFADEILKQPIPKREAGFVRGVCLEWRAGVDSGQWKDVTGPMAMSDADYGREVVQRTMFYTAPEVVRSQDKPR